MNDSNYIQIGGWMVNQLNLKGNELLLYAMIYGFSQDGTSEFCAGSNYIAEWLNVSKRTALTTLQSLCDKGLLNKREIEVANNIKVCHYSAVVPGASTSPPVKNLHRPGEKISPLIINNIKNNNTLSIPTVDQVAEYCRERGNNVDAETFVDYYSARGWKTAGGVKIKDWQACVRTWERRDKERSNKPMAKPTSKFSNYQQREGVDYDAILRQLN